jgi:glycosyltransferase involved in cell wall biosynthesis
MQRARAFVFPSGLEAFGQVVSEAMSMGCPPITFDNPPFTEFIIHDQDGILVPPNSPSELANAVNRVIVDPEWGRRIGEAARRNILKLCSEETFVQSTLDYYREICAMPQ